jgi:hypothetical protein
VLTGVQYQQQVAVAQVGEHGVLRPASGLLREAERVRHCGREQPGFAQRGQLDQADAVLEQGVRLCGGAQRDPSLADAAWTGDGDETGVLKQGGEPRDLVLAPDKAGRLHWEPPLLPGPGALADEHAILT